MSRAFDASGCPSAFQGRPELAAPLVAEIGATIREIQLRRRTVELAICRESVTESAHEQAGGPAYAGLRSAMEAAQERYFAQRRARSEIRESYRVEMERLQTEFEACRRRHEPFVDQTRAAAVRAYWAAHPPRVITDQFFNGAPALGATSRMSRLEPAWWWRSFLPRLQHEFGDRHSADGRFLDTLPLLRREAKKKTLAAVIAEWTEEYAEEWGWDGPGHYRMLAIRANDKAREMADWFNARAPGYLEDESVRRSLHDTLADFLAGRDPLAALIASELARLGAHGHN